MILVDTSVWIEFLRGTASTATAFVRDRLGSDLATTEPVLMEVLAGTRRGAQTEQVERLLLSQHWLRVDPTVDYRGAVEVFQHARAAGHQPRALQDCLIAAVALRHGATLAHRNDDYERLSSAVGLTVLDLR
ncbi:type II toxin-antitoxin system VapC family toxin [Occultella glacieicola]|uniref:type II toxin-antitoxin system VapC family toxin n=1 Tax=Occultella glacieicola TaxID=2518684 RepID=UPI0014054C53|nr:PIN domain nuclease [Occultella glacieicola]